MTKDEEEEILRVISKLDVSEVMSLLIKSGNRYSRRILKFFKWFTKWMPIIVMLVHWVAMFDFGRNHYDMLEPYSDNWVSYVFTYIMLYVFPIVMILASRFFWLCWRYRIPFIYFFGVNAVHIAYWSWYTTNEMIKSIYAIVIMALVLYAYGFIDLFINNTKLGRRICA